MSAIIAAASPSTVEVLLSTHNGERYIAAQLASILSQSHRDLRVVVRDDASTDRTVEVVRAIVADDPRVRVVEGPRLGWGGSFMELLASSGDARWLAFSDQDDVWLPDKLARAVAALQPLDDRPALYGSAMLHVTEELRWLAPSRVPRVGFENALAQNVIAGCTMVLNRAARDLCLEGMPRHTVHDWWVYLVIAALGTIIFDEEMTVLHRVHGGNATAVALRGHWLKRVITHVKLPPRRRLSGVVGDFYRAYGDSLDRERRAIVEELLAQHGKSWIARARYAWRSPLFRQTRVDDAILRVLLTLGRF